MLIINQAGNEMYLLENIVSIKILKQTENGIDAWYVAADPLEYDIYVKLGKYKDEVSAESAFRLIYKNYDYQERSMKMNP